MTTLSDLKPIRKRRALLVAIRQVRSGSKFGNLDDLPLAHRDAKELRDPLILHGYHEDDITLMMDAKDHPRHLWPTRKRILQQIDRLVRDAPEDCHFFFYFSGHGMQEDGGDRASMRADGREGEIISANGEPIPDYILHDRLVKPLQSVKGSKLFTLFDCCHSETLLDLQRGNRPNTYSRAWNYGPGQRFISLATAIARFLRMNKPCRENPPSVPPPLLRVGSKWGDSLISKTEEATVICLSACRDRQDAHDDCERELTFTKCFMDAIAARPGITWVELRDRLKELVSEIRNRYEETYLNIPHDRWSQDPRYSTSSHVDLTRIVSL